MTGCWIGDAAPVAQACAAGGGGTDPRAVSGAVCGFNEIWRREHADTLSYSYVKQALQTAGLVKNHRALGRHRRRREPRACFGE